MSDQDRHRRISVTHSLATTEVGCCDFCMGHVHFVVAVVRSPTGQVVRFCDQCLAVVGQAAADRQRLKKNAAERKKRLD